MHIHRQYITGINYSFSESKVLLFSCYKGCKLKTEKRTVIVLFSDYYLALFINRVHSILMVKEGFMYILLRHNTRKEYHEEEYTQYFYDPVFHCCFCKDSIVPIYYHTPLPTPSALPMCLVGIKTKMPGKIARHQ